MSDVKFTIGNEKFAKEIQQNQSHEHRRIQYIENTNNDR